jgi:4-amino-4-deoxy-L-arabinose transferase-like glycosyltransferase
MRAMLSNGLRWLLCRGGWESIALALLAVASPFLIFYNLEHNPRPWQDEGNYLLLAKTLSMDGVYAVRSSEGYQTFGAVQSVGPTVLLPIALSFKLFGVGLVQGRVVAGALALLTLVVFFGCGLKMFGRRAALLSVVFLLTSPAAGFLMYGRPAIGEIPALGFLLAGWYVWSAGVQSNRRWLYLVAGLLVGAAMVTKSQYVIIGFGALALLALLELVYYRQGRIGGIVVLGVVAGACVAAWWLWQIAYFGMATFQANAAKMATLAHITMGLYLHDIVYQVETLFSSSLGFFYYFWGFLALAYGAALCLPRKRDSLILAFPWLFAAVYLGYFTFLTAPRSRGVFPAAAIVAFFVAKLCVDLVAGLAASRQEFWKELRQFWLGRAGLSAGALIALGALAGLLSLGSLTAYQLHETVELDVLDTNGVERPNVGPPQFQSPERVAAFLNQVVPKGALIETWETELGILSDHRFHFPDQFLLAEAQDCLLRGGDRNYALGADYFKQVRPDYVVIGWHSRYLLAYDLDFIAQHGKLIKSIGDGDWCYDVYEMHLNDQPNVSSQEY